MKPSRIRALVGALKISIGFLLCMVVAAFPAGANAAPTLTLPSFQALATPAAPALDASASAPAASTSSSSDADISRSLDTIISTLDMPKLPLSQSNAAHLFGGDEVEHYHQAVALVVAETFEQARAAAQLIRVDYVPAEGRFDLAAEAEHAELKGDSTGEGSGEGSSACGRAVAKDIGTGRACEPA